MVERTIAGSLCLGVYGPEGQLGFARVITDRALFAWMADVFVLQAARGKGLGKAMVAACLAHPDLADVQRWMLVTSDADKLYESFGFTWVLPEDRLMKRIGRQPAGASENPRRTP
jgi:GNAT superfamily N-acetyltransferase